MQRSPGRRCESERSGWRAFLLGMAGMFAVIILWLVLTPSAGGDVERETKAEPVTDARTPTEDYR